MGVVLVPPPFKMKKIFPTGVKDPDSNKKLLEVIKILAVCVGGREIPILLEVYLSSAVCF